MTISLSNQDLDKIIMVGDRVLIKPKTTNEKTRTGLYLPPGIEEKEAIHVGYVVKVGPGYLIPSLSEDDEPWKSKENEIKFIPLQSKVGDQAVYLQKSGYEIEFNNEKYVIVPHSAILMLIRDEELFK